MFILYISSFEMNIMKIVGQRHYNQANIKKFKECYNNWTSVVGCKKKLWFVLNFYFNIFPFIIQQLIHIFVAA